MTQGDSIADESWNSSCDTATRQRQQQEADKIAAALKTPIDLGAWHRAVNSGVYLYESRTMYISALYTPFDLGIALSTQVCLSTRVTNYLYTSPLHAAWHRAVNSGVFILRVTNYLYASPLHAYQFFGVASCCQIRCVYLYESRIIYMPAHYTPIHLWRGVALLLLN